ncbi:MAG: hypothetical protein ABI837_18465 [Acidobacteriota bacterium]
MHSGSFGRFGIAAIGAVALIAFLDLFLEGSPGAGAPTWYVIGERVFAYGLALIAAGMAAARFGWWREHVGRAWTLFAVEFLLLLVNYLLRRLTPDARVALDVTLIGANLAQLAAYFLMARVLGAAGLSHMTSMGKRILLTAVALAIALVLCHSPLVDQWNEIRAGTVRLASLVAVLADLITFTMIAPLALSMLTLRGGYLAWMFGFLTVSVVGWMINGDAESIAQTLGNPANGVRAARLVGLLIAALFNAAAAGTQWTGLRLTVEGAGTDG